MCGEVRVSGDGRRRRIGASMSSTSRIRSSLGRREEEHAQDEPTGGQRQRLPHQALPGSATSEATPHPASPASDRRHGQPRPQPGHPAEAQPAELAPGDERGRRAAETMLAMVAPGGDRRDDVLDGGDHHTATAQAGEVDRRS